MATTDIENTIACENCDGKGFTTTYTIPEGALTHNCKRCGGSGRISEEQQYREELGLHIRDFRSVELEEYAKLLGISAPKLSDMEHGRF